MHDGEPLKTPTRATDARARRGDERRDFLRTRRGVA
jgi:hypothetical protein